MSGPPSCCPGESPGEIFFIILLFRLHPAIPRLGVGTGPRNQHFDSFTGDCNIQRG